MKGDIHISTGVRVKTKTNIPEIYVKAEVDEAVLEMCFELEEGAFQT